MSDNDNFEQLEKRVKKLERIVSLLAIGQLVPLVPGDPSAIALENLEKENADLRTRLGRANENMRSVSERLAKALDANSPRLSVRKGKWCVWNSAGPPFWTPCESMLDALNALERQAG